MSATPDPRAFLRDGIDLDATVAVALPSGVKVHLRPARCTPEDLLAGRASAYAVAALRSRDAWVRLSRTGAPVEPLTLGELVVEAIRDTYDAPPEVVEAWLAGFAESTLIEVLAVAVGAKAANAANAKEAGRARALVAAGFGRVPLSVVEAVGLADWSANTGRAPAWG
jgi:hypothetical protein